MSDNCDYNFGTFDDFGVKMTKKVSNNMILMSKYKGKHGGKQGRKIRAGASPPPFRAMPKRKHFFFRRASLRAVKILLLMTLHSFSLEESCCSSIWFSTCSSSESLWLVSFNYCQRERVLLHLLATIWKGGENCQEDQNQGNSFLELFVSGAKAQGVRKCVISRNLSEWRLFNFT